MMWVMEAVGVLLFVYVVWRILRDNYDEVAVIALGWLMVLGFFAGGKLMGLALAGLDEGFEWQGWMRIPIEPLGGWLLAIGVACWWAWVNNWKVCQLAEDVAEVAVALMVWFEVRRLLLGFDIKQLVLVAEILIALIVAVWLRGRYRSLWWYKSGKKGFVFFFLGFLVLELLAIAEVIMGGRVWLFGAEAIAGLLFGAGLIMLGRG